MKFSEFRKTYLTPFGKTEYIWSKDGYIVWRLGTGGNVELLHIRSFIKGKGVGRRLVHLMLLELKKKPPYHSVYGFTRVANENAVCFYKALGFHVEIVDGPYQKGKAVLFSQSYKVLLRRLR
jgi:ribosomal protein S18 acetylase RimI-like enzyme